MKKQEAYYIYRYRYNGGGATQVWLSSDRFVVIDLSAGPCTYGKIETEEGTVSLRTLPRPRNAMFPRGLPTVSDAHEVFVGQLTALVATTIEHVIALDVRFETVDLTTRLLIPIIVLHNHNRYNIMAKGHNNSIDIEAIEAAEAVKQTLEQVPLMKEIVDHFSGPDRVTTKKQNRGVGKSCKYPSRKNS